MIKPLFPSYRIESLDQARHWSESMGGIIRDDLAEPFRIACVLLYRKGARSHHTFYGMRSEFERFFLWLLEGDLSIDCGPEQIMEYLSFCASPPRGWVAQARFSRYSVNGDVNPDWRPFVVSDVPDRTKAVVRNPSQASIRRQLSFLQTLYEDLVEADCVRKSPVTRARRETPHLSAEEETSPHVLTPDQWTQVLSHLVALAQEDGYYERALFVVVLMKGLYLRISEVSDRPGWHVRFSDFYEEQGYLFFRVQGKRKKVRSVAVPDSLLPFIERYRVSRGLDDRLMIYDDSPLVAKKRGQGSPGVRQMQRIVQDAFDAVIERIGDSDPVLSRTLSVATTHWLRHSGASQDVETRSLRDLADDMGHGDLGTTAIYTKSQKVDRAKRTRGRSISD